MSDVSETDIISCPSCMSDYDSKSYYAHMQGRWESAIKILNPELVEWHKQNSQKDAEVIARTEKLYNDKMNLCEENHALHKQNLDLQKSMAQMRAWLVVSQAWMLIDNVRQQYE